MSEHVEAQAESPEMSHGEYEESNFDLGETLIGLLGGLVVFGFTFGVMAALVAIVRVSEAPGWTIQQFMDVLHLIPPNGVSLSDLPAISFTPPTQNPGYWVYEFLMLNIAWIVSLFAGLWGYNKVMSLPSSDED